MGGVNAWALTSSGVWESSAAVPSVNRMIAAPKKAERVAKVDQSTRRSQHPKANFVVTNHPAAKPTRKAPPAKAKGQSIPPAAATQVPAKANFQYDFFSPYVSWGIDPDDPQLSVNLKTAWANFEQKKEVVVAIIDTGIDYNHPFIRNNIIVKEGVKGPQNYGVDFSQGKKSMAPNDDNGHGTHVAGIIRSVYPNVKLLILKYYNPQASGQANVDATVAAFKYAVDHKVDIINYSGGGPEFVAEEKAAIEKAVKEGILVVAAAGNEASDIDLKSNNYFPASYGLSNIIAVTAYNQQLNIMPLSNYGKHSVHLAAPGHRIRSSFPNGRSGYLTGTSQATAFVSGAAALIKAQHPEISNARLKDVLISQTDLLPAFVGKTTSGGKLDTSKAMAEAKQIPRK